MDVRRAGTSNGARTSISADSDRHMAICAVREQMLRCKLILLLGRHGSMADVFDPGMASPDRGINLRLGVERGLDHLSDP